MTTKLIWNLTQLTAAIVVFALIEPTLEALLEGLIETIAALLP